MRKRNRKRTAVSLAAMMVLGMLGNTGITARAEDVEQEAVAPQSESADMIAVDISWGSLAFTYKDGQWDPETCTYIGGGWEARSGGRRFGICYKQRNCCRPGGISIYCRRTDRGKKSSGNFCGWK